MTYAAQVRSAGKSLPIQNVEEMTDIKSLRIICKYFVGSIVNIKTNDEYIEGVLHTFYKNKICLSYVTCHSKNSSNIKSVKSKIVLLTDILAITMNGSSVETDVTIKNHYIYNVVPYVSPKFESKNDPNGSKETQSQESNKSVQPIKCETNFTSNTKEDIIEIIKSDVCEEKHNDKLNNIENQASEKETTKLDPAGDSSDDISVTSSTKKQFSFNPNAPEFKPRSTTGSLSNSNVVFPPQQILTSASPNDMNHIHTTTPQTLFVPNYVLFDSRSYNAIVANELNNHESNWTSPKHKISKNPNDVDVITDNSFPKPSFYPPISIFVPNNSIVPITLSPNHIQPTSHMDKNGLSHAPVHTAVSTNFSDTNINHTHDHNHFPTTVQHINNTQSYNNALSSLDYYPKVYTTHKVSISNHKSQNCENIPHHYNNSKKYVLSAHKSNKDTELSNPNIWPPLPEPNKPLATLSSSSSNN